MCFMKSLICEYDELILIANKLENHADTINEYIMQIEHLITSIENLGWRDELKIKIDNYLILIQKEILPVVESLRNYSDLKFKESSLCKEILNLNIPSNY